VSGDFSDDGLHPTNVGILTLGSNQIFGTTGRGDNGIDRDYFTVTVPSGAEWVSLIELPGTEVGGDVSFLGVEAGNQVTLSVFPNDATGLLGWTHYSVADINTDLLPTMSVPSEGSSGFTTPLGAGEYSFWIQEFDSGTFPYGFNIVLAPAPAVPEPGSIAMSLGLGMTGAAFLRRRRAH
jgi:hypothetical protein